jgi:hypothetical protein
MFLAKLRAAGWGLLLAASVGAAAVGLSLRSGAQAPPSADERHHLAAPRGAAGSPRANPPTQDDLEALRLEMEALRRELRATQSRVKALEAAAPAPGAPAPGAGLPLGPLPGFPPPKPGAGLPPGTLPPGPGAGAPPPGGFAPPPPGGLAPHARRGSRPPGGEADARAALTRVLRRLQERPDDPAHLEELERLVQRLREQAGPGTPPPAGRPVRR